MIKYERVQEDTLFPRESKPALLSIREWFSVLIDYLCNPEKYPPMPKWNPRIQRTKAFTFRNGRMIHNQRDH